MKKYLYLVFITFIFIGCEGAYKRDGKSDIDMLIFGKDTIVVTGANSIGFSKLHHYSIRGHKDTLTGIWYTYIMLNSGIDSITLENSILCTWEHNKPECQTIKIESQKGDVLMDNATKTVYEK